ncbi:hypothetical protein DHEL01_v203829 [Diaporthe helianthi]|uniref:Survival Motor Neuron Gemin2-binding domain-containing protein n=1 Tax=Diaporthe helianthi TaxID=158607 RepID=A0A2P5I5L0_DIAHE|nr:hypothetical protein DHEL01_v203829 [Diaporthe helianthi]
MEGQGIEMADDDVWDDSALIRSWDEALDEYKPSGQESDTLQTGPKSFLSFFSQAEPAQLTRRRRYSQDAKPETSGTHHQPETVSSSAALTLDQNTPSNQPAQQQPERIAAGSTDDASKDGMNDGVASGSGDDRYAGEGLGESAAEGNMAPPQFLMGSVQDEGLKRLLMSWYYAGYYTGLYEGRQTRRDQQ